MPKKNTLDSQEISGGSAPKCMAPFVQLTLRPDGKVIPCCHLYNQVLGDAQRSSLKTIWNSSKINKLRTDLCTDQPKICKSRMFYKKCHLEFERFRKSQYLNAKADAFYPNSPIRYDMRLNGQCNLQCVMCEVWKEPNGKWNNSDLWKLSKDEILNLCEIDILGGEPLIQKDTYRFIDKVSLVNQNVSYGIVTNGQMQFPGKVENTFKKMRFRFVEVSMDARTAETYRKIRVPAEIGVAHQFLNKLMAFRQWYEDQYQESFEIRVGFCTQPKNYLELPDFIRWANALHLKPDIQFIHFDPSGENSFHSNSIEEVETAKNFLRSHLNSNEKAIAAEALLAIDGVLSKKIKNRLVSQK